MKLRNKKTGKIGDLMGSKPSAGSISICIDYHDGSPTEYFYNSIAEINADWEDCNQKEPLIKDEKVRKAVRAWAEALKLANCRYDSYWKALRFCDQTISFFGLCDFDLEDGRIYDIAELCGEEEE